MTKGDQPEEPQNPRFSESQLREPSRWDPGAALGSPGPCLWAVRHGEGITCFYSFWLPARTPLDGSTVGAVGCRHACRQSPSSSVSPLPRLTGATAHPAPFQGVSRGKQRTPHIRDCTGGEKKIVSHEAFCFRKTKNNLFRN